MRPFPGRKGGWGPCLVGVAGSYPTTSTRGGANPAGNGGCHRFGCRGSVQAGKGALGHSAHRGGAPAGFGPARPQVRRDPLGASADATPRAWCKVARATLPRAAWQVRPRGGTRDASRGDAPAAVRSALMPDGFPATSGLCRDEVSVRWTRRRYPHRPSLSSSTGPRTGFTVERSRSGRATGTPAGLIGP